MLNEISINLLKLQKIVLNNPLWGGGVVRELKLKFKNCVPLHDSERKRFKLNSDKNKGLNFNMMKQFINHKRINVNYLFNKKKKNNLLSVGSNQVVCLSVSC